MPKISVIIPAYQSAGTISATLTSLFSQTRQPDEVVIVDDGSTDNLLLAIQPWSTKVQYIHQAQQGAPVARNAGFAASNGEYVLFLDADITMKSSMLEKMEAALVDHPQADYAYSDHRFGWKAFHVWPYSYDRLQQMNYIHTSSLLRRSSFPGFDPSLKKFQDWDLWLTIAERGGQGIWIPEMLYSIQPRKKGLGLSSWMPKFVYRLPFIGQGKGNAQVAAYRSAEAIIREKHHLK